MKIQKTKLFLFFFGGGGGRAGGAVVRSGVGVEGGIAWFGVGG